MKIAIIGTHGTFKTTLVYFLAGVLKAKGKSVGIIREMATACPYFKDGRGNILAQNWIILTQVQLERDYEQIYDYVICDRSVVDNYIYAIQAYKKEEQPLPGWIEPFVLHHLKSYDYLFKTYGKQTYGYEPDREKRGLAYLIIEPDNDKPWRQKGWLETVVQGGETVWVNTLLNGLILEKRKY